MGLGESITKKVAVWVSSDLFITGIKSDYVLVYLRYLHYTDILMEFPGP